MKRLSFVLFFDFLMLCSCVHVNKSKAHLNFLVIVVDDVGWSDLSCYGRKSWNTPHIDKLADEGLRFTDAYAAASVCSPTRASLLTGKYPARLRLTDWIPGFSESYKNPVLIAPKFTQHLNLEETTIAERLSKLGYTTASIGKWHIGSEDLSPDKQGFNYQFLVSYHNVGEKGYFNYGPDGKEVESGKGKYLEELLVDKAEGWLQENRNHPFFLYFATHVVHTPIQAVKEKVDKYTKLGLPLEGPGNAVYAAMCEHMDENVGRLLQCIDNLGLKDNTVVFFISDNGGRDPQTKNIPLRGGKGELYEGGIRVPMIVRWPKEVEAKTMSSEPVISNDIVPTIMDIATGQKNKLGIDGVSLVKLLKGGDSLGRGPLFWHYPHYNGHPYGKPSSAVRNGDFKLMEFLENGQLELYDLSDDLSERNNLAPEMPELVEKLKIDLDKWRKDVKAQMPSPNPDYIPSIPSGL